MAVSGDIFGCHNMLGVGRLLLLASGKEKPRMLLKVSGSAAATPKTEPAPNASSAEVEKCWSKRKYDFILLFTIVSC